MRIRPRLTNPPNFSLRKLPELFPSVRTLKCKSNDLLPGSRVCPFAANMRTAPLNHSPQQIATGLQTSANEVASSHLFPPLLPDGLGLGPAVLREAAKLSGHVRTVSYESKNQRNGACALRSSGVLRVGFDTPRDSRIFLKLPCRIGIRVGAFERRDRSPFTLFILFLSYVIISRMKEALSFNLTRSDEPLLVSPLARNQLSILQNTNIGFKRLDAQNSAALLTSHFPLQSLCN